MAYLKQHGAVYIGPEENERYIRRYRDRNGAEWYSARDVRDICRQQMATMHGQIIYSTAETGHVSAFASADTVMRFALMHAPPEVPFGLWVKTLGERTDTWDLSRQNAESD